MEIEERSQGAKWRWSLLFSVVFLNICIPSLVLSYGVYLVHSIDLGLPIWLGLATPAIFILTYGLTQCWCRDAADSWGGPVGYRVMAAVGLVLVVVSLLLCAFIPYQFQPYMYGVLGGLGSSLISAQVDAVVFETYDTRLGIIRGACLTGQAIGQSLFPHIITALIDTYGYSLSYIILGGIILQTMPAILLLKVEDRNERQTSYSRYSDFAKYAVFSNELVNNNYNIELQLHDLGKKCWKSPSDDNLHREEEMIYDDDEDEDSASGVTITPPPSPEEKRRNIFGVEILPEIPEESEDSDDDEQQDLTDKDASKPKNKKPLSFAIKRLSMLGDNFDEYIMKQTRRDSQSNESKEYTEIEVTYDNITPITDIQREKIFNSFSFRFRSTYASMRRKMWMPSYRVYRLRRRLVYLMYNINDTFVKPLTRSLSCWRFYPALILSFAKLSLTAVALVLLPMIASKVHPKISMSESNFLMSLHGFTWICVMLSTPWLAQTPRRNYKYVVVAGLFISTAACFVLTVADDHDTFSIGCVVAGLGYGAIASCWETAVQDFVGVRKWPKFHSTLETLSALLLVALVVALCFLLEEDNGLEHTMFLLGIILFIVTIVWSILAAVSLYYLKIRSIRIGRRWFI